MSLLIYGWKFITTGSPRFRQIVRFKSKIEMSIVEPANVKSPLVNARNRQVVFILGWTNSSVKNLKKYSELYEREGHAVVSWCPPASMVYGLDPRKRWESQRDTLMSTLRYLRNKMGQPEPTVFFHIFSGGIFAYYLMCKCLEDERYKDVRISGAVFDSTLASSKFFLVYRAMQAVAPGKVVAKSVLAFGGAIVTYFVILGNVLKDFIRGDASTTENYRFFNYAMICSQPNFGPQMFLYSKVDVVMDHRSVTKLIERRREQGVKVFYRLWENSPHVKHFHVHREEYEELLKQFREYCQRENPVSVYEVVNRDIARPLGLMEKWERR